MINVKVKSLWQGQVGVRDKYIREAKSTQQDILITCDGRRLLIKYDEIDRLIRGRSAVAFRDKFSNARHYLYYFNWLKESESEQKTLFNN
mgnify:CR=1 FL=1